jgi:hypothetical protein
MFLSDLEAKANAALQLRDAAHNSPLKRHLPMQDLSQGDVSQGVPNSPPPTTPPNTPTTQKCGVICQKKKKRKILLIGLGVLLVGGVSYFILKKK